MDNIKDNKGTPLKRTALNNDFAKENKSSNDHNYTREINTPKPQQLLLLFQRKCLQGEVQ